MNTLYYGDNLDVLRLHVEDHSVDLVYLDPPFNSNASYNVLFAEQDGSRAAAQIEAFTDTWRWDQAAVYDYETTVEQGGGVAAFLMAMRTFLGDVNLLAYLSMMAPRLVELRRVLKPTGSIFLHCDPSAGHYLKLLMDSVFGAQNFRNEIAWCYTGPSAPGQRQFSRKHDLIFWYSMGEVWTFNADAVRIPYNAKTLENYKTGLVGSGFVAGDEDQEREINDGKIPEDYWPIAIAARSTRERLHYPTQKPVALLERIISAASDPGGVVLDPFCGCGTTVVAAQELGREWLGIDITHLAINLINWRFANQISPPLIARTDYQVIGEPTDLAGARQLAHDDPYQFQWWALDRVQARPTVQKKGADKGIDGKLLFHDEQAGGQTKTVIISVKAGHTGRNHVHELRGVIEREKAAIGVLISMQSPTGPMREEAASAGFYEAPWGQKYPRIQLLTIADLLDGRTIAMPALGSMAKNVSMKTSKLATKKAPAKASTLPDEQLPLG